MAAYEVLLLNTAIPQIQAAQSGDTYVVPRDIAFSTVANLANGTNLLPSLTFSSDTNTGIYREGADALGFTAGGGTNQMVLTSTGLGIGTTSPLARLSVQLPTTSPAGYTAAANSGITLDCGTSTNGVINLVGGGDLGIFHSNSSNAYDVGIGFGNNANRHLTFVTANAERMRLDSSGNLGLGVTPSAWSSLAGGAFQNGGNGALWSQGTDELYVSQNVFFNGASRYVETRAASAYQQSSGNHRWYTAPSGTAGNAITFTQAMTLDASGNLGIGQTSPSYKLDVSGIVRISNGGDSYFGFGANKDNYFTTGTTSGKQVWRNATGTEYMTLDASGNLLVGDTSTNDNATLVVRRAGATVGATTYTLGWFQNATGYENGLAIKATDNAVTIAADFAGNTGGAAALVFATNSTSTANNATERARITSGGDFYVGTTGLPVSNGRLTVSASSGETARLYQSGGDGQPSLALDKSSTTTTTSQVFAVFTVNAQATGSGQINANGASQAAFGSFSDRRLKENIVDLESQWQNIKSLRPVEFDYVANEGGGHQIGFIAQEVQTAYPDLVGERSDGMLTLSGMGKNEARLIKTLQEAMARIETLEAKIAALEAK